MKKPSTLRSAFTLIEMLVVIVIMSLLATALVSALKSAQRQAQAALCQAHLKNLHQACMNFLADKGAYPYAGSYEYFDSYDGKYSERQGWVAWVREDGKTDNDGNPFNPWAADKGQQSHAEEYIHAGWSGEIAERSIREGTVFQYSTRDTSTYFCKSFKAEVDKNKDDLKVRRSYAMNNWFGSRRNERARGRKLLDFQTSNPPIEPSRMGYIIELQTTKHSGDKNKGEPAGQNTSNRKSIPDDSVWEHADDERYGTYHRKAGDMHGHVIFVDGHIESLTSKTSSHGDDHETQNSKLGNGKF